MKRKVYYPQAVLAATKNNKLTPSAFRKGVLYLDATNIGTKRYSYNNLTNQYVQLNYIFDTVAHVNYAKLQDAEDWESNADFKDTIPLSNLFVELFNTLQSDIEGAINGDTTIVFADVNVEIYGVGNRCATVNFQLYSDQEGLGRDAVHTFDVANQLHTNRHYLINVNNWEVKFVYNEKNIQPTGYTIKRKFCPAVVNYLAEGLSLL